ncbi:hypothetical protein [Neobacillus sp. NPDC093127]|uniref:hypothetical protein n=1 Tax=Neobacillus sp. NPDC093127 TaxID=3364296 RepID=UPI00381A8D63
MKKIIRNTTLVIVVVVIFLLLHLTPKIAIRTHVLFMGYPIESFTSDIYEYKFSYKVDKNNFIKFYPNAKAYTLTKPPFEKATESELSNYIVRKSGFLYFADIYGET